MERHISFTSMRKLCRNEEECSDATVGEPLFGDHKSKGARDGVFRHVSFVSLLTCLRREKRWHSNDLDFLYYAPIR